LQFEKGFLVPFLRQAQRPEERAGLPLAGVPGETLVEDPVPCLECQRERDHVLRLRCAGNVGQVRFVPAFRGQPVPRVDPSRHAPGLLKTALPEDRGGGAASDAGPAVRDGRLGPVELPEAAGEIGDRDETRARKVAFLVFPRLPNVDEVVRIGGLFPEEGPDLLGGHGGYGLEIIEQSHGFLPASGISSDENHMFRRESIILIM
jgi:hypothetical protein